MNRLPVAIAIAGGMLASSTTLAANGPHSFAAKRQAAIQIVSCMKKRMAADRHLSYNEAGRACRDEVFKQYDGSADSGPLVADVKH
jgi:hypothetical protein